MDVLKEAAVFLEEKGIENPRLNAEQLLGRTLGLSRMDLYLRFEQPLHPQEREAYKTLLRRRAAHEPLQYILGETEFFSLSFRITPHVLIPRPETETLVERVMDAMKDEERIRILDIGVGSGNIAVSLARNLGQVDVVGADISDEVLTVARENAERNGVGEKIRFLLADVGNNDFCRIVGPPFDAVVSNPPYVSREAWNRLPEEIRGHEPRTALCDDGDGLVFFRVIVPKGRQLLKRGGVLFLEVGDEQSEDVEHILKDAGYGDVAAFPDLNGIQRVVRGVSV